MKEYDLCELIQRKCREPFSSETSFESCIEEGDSFSTKEYDFVHNTDILYGLQRILGNWISAGAKSGQRAKDFVVKEKETNKVIGAVGFRESEDWNTKEFAIIFDAFSILPELRNKGNGKKILKDFEVGIRKCNFVKSIKHSMPNEMMQGLLNQIGYDKVPDWSIWEKLMK